MKYNKSTFKISIIIISILSHGCFATPSPGATQGVNNEAGTKIAITPTSTSYSVSAATSFPVTEIPTLPFDEAREKSTYLLKDNNNCQLPCWWGITPGKTKWQDAFLILAPLGGEILENMAELNGKGSIFVRPPAPDSQHKVLFQTYYLEDGVVATIEVYSYDYAPFTHFKTLISEYGIPDEIYIRGHRDAGFRLALFYPNQGILAEYSRTITSSSEKNIRTCYEEADSPFLYLWASKHPITFEDAIVNLRVPTEDIPPFVSIDEALINPIDFVESLNQLEEPSCIETPKDLWPPKY